MTPLIIIAVILLGFVSMLAGASFVTWNNSRRKKFQRRRTPHLDSMTEEELITLIVSANKILKIRKGRAPTAEYRLW